MTHTKTRQKKKRFHWNENIPESSNIGCCQTVAWELEFLPLCSRFLIQDGSGHEAAPLESQSSRPCHSGASEGTVAAQPNQEVIVLHMLCSLMKNIISQSQKSLLTKRPTQSISVSPAEKHILQKLSVSLALCVSMPHHAARTQAAGSSSSPQADKLSLARTTAFFSLLLQPPPPPEEFQCVSFPKCPNRTLGEEQSAHSPLSPCSLSSHFKKLKRKTSFLCHRTDMGAIQFHSCWWPGAEHTGQFFLNSTCATHQNNMQPCSQCSLCVRDFQAPPLWGLNLTSPSLKKHNLKEEQLFLLEIRHLKIQIESYWQ